MATKVLVIEDDERTRRLYKAAMAFQGMNVSTAANAAQGFKKFLSFKPDLVILDIMLSGDGEMNIIKKFREHGATHSLPVVILSDLKDESIRKEASILGACEYLIKSENSIGDLITKVRTILKIDVGKGTKSAKK
ncbi:response regulator [bacterium]|nr:response regulator [bacterium]